MISKYFDSALVKALAREIATVRAKRQITDNGRVLSDLTVDEYVNE